MNQILLLSIVAVLFCATGCGQKGPLILPEKAQALVNKDALQQQKTL